MRRRRPPEPPWALLSYLLRYPDADVYAARKEIDNLPDGRVREALERFAGAWTGDPAHYVEIFDLRRRACLHLTYYAHGDTRKRGMALLRLKKLYRAAGFPMAGAELPDHLVVMLAFAAVAPEGYGPAVLGEHRAALELLRLSLHDSGSPYAHLLDAIAACLPELTVTDRADVARLVREGPPDEAVGLEPYAPAELMGDPRPAARVAASTRPGGSYSRARRAEA